MKDSPSWRARERPMGGDLPIAIVRCERCGRGLYTTLRGQGIGQVFCRGCDEEKAGCYCPETREGA